MENPFSFQDMDVGLLIMVPPLMNGKYNVG
jgi:hypothetical protein